MTGLIRRQLMMKKSSRAYCNRKYAIIPGPNRLNGSYYLIFWTGKPIILYSLSNLSQSLNRPFIFEVSMGSKSSRRTISIFSPFVTIILVLQDIIYKFSLSAYLFTISFSPFHAVLPLYNYPS